MVTNGSPGATRTTAPSLHRPVAHVSGEATTFGAGSLGIAGYTSGISNSTIISEVWPNAPLALVAVEVRFPAEGTGPFRAPVLRAIRDLVDDSWVLEGAKQQTLDLAVGPAGVQQTNYSVENLTPIMARDRTHSVTVRPESLTVETTRYEGYEGFRSLVGSSFAAVEQVLQPQGATRLGLRYIDEIRVPSLEGDNPWDAWLDRSLLAPRGKGLRTKGWTGAVQYDVSDDRSLVLRYGPSDGPVVNPPGPLRRSSLAASGQIFFLDFDSFWQPLGIPAFSAPELLDICDLLREPVRSLFDQLVSSRLVDDVFRKEQP